MPTKKYLKQTGIKEIQNIKASYANQKIFKANWYKRNPK